MDVPVLRSIEEVRDWISVAGQTIGLEGFCGVGKSTLAASLREIAGYVSIDTDDFVKVKGGNTYYVERLDLESVKQSIQDKAIAGDGMTIVHGICLRDIMRRIDLELDVFIYIRKVSQPRVDMTLWHGGA